MSGLTIAKFREARAILDANACKSDQRYLQFAKEQTDKLRRQFVEEAARKLYRRNRGLSRALRSFVLPAI